MARPIPYIRWMRLPLLFALCGVLAVACTKDDDAVDSGPTLPVERRLYVDLAEDMDSTELSVRMVRATQDYVDNRWSAEVDGWRLAVVPNGQANPVYRNDRLSFIGQVPVAREVIVRVDGLQPWTVQLDPAQNGQASAEVTVTW